MLIEDVTDLGGFEFQLNFDDSIANLEIQLGPFLGSEGARARRSTASTTSALALPYSAASHRGPQPGRVAPA